MTETRLLIVDVGVPSLAALAVNGVAIGDQSLLVVKSATMDDTYGTSEGER